MKWSFYDSEGFFKPWTFTGPEHLLAKSTPEGCLAIEGSFDHMSKRVVDGVVVEWRPDKPEATEFYDWDLVGGRWLKSLTFEGRRQSWFCDIPWNAFQNLTEPGNIKSGGGG